ncbi:DUF6980 family protein [Mycetocola zhujimingii]|uniref:DUF6980 family protein n=1 Tax=Mycetocola zhujimingii TaxID=2079792 RepID=UPI0013C4C5D0|nr:hypothetical protein [Mycetocola zhujimingii]
MNVKRDVPPHGCPLMLAFLEDERVPIHYYAPERQYAITVFNGPPDGEGPHPIQLLFYCPWCGAKLPMELGDQWHEDLGALLGEDFLLLLDVEGAIPAAYESDEWWQGRFDWDGNQLAAG